MHPIWKVFIKLVKLLAGILGSHSFLGTMKELMGTNPRSAQNSSL